VFGKTNKESEAAEFRAVGLANLRDPLSAGGLRPSFKIAEDTQTI